MIFHSSYHCKHQLEKQCFRSGFELNRFPTETWALKRPVCLEPNRWLRRPRVAQLQHNSFPFDLLHALDIDWLREGGTRMHLIEQESFSVPSWWRPECPANWSSLRRGVWIWKFKSIAYNDSTPLWTLECQQFQWSTRHVELNGFFVPFYNVRRQNWPPTTFAMWSVFSTFRCWKRN